jgi:hypothetical protein
MGITVKLDKLFFFRLFERTHCLLLFKSSTIKKEISAATITRNNESQSVIFKPVDFSSQMKNFMSLRVEGEAT